MCLYLYDEGIRVLYRPRFGDLGPDALSTSPTPILAEAQAYKNSSKARSDIKGGFAQCVSYLNNLSSLPAGGIYEAHLIIFREDGPLYKLPELFLYEDYRIYPVLVDLAPPVKRGRDQARARVAHISADEILEYITEKES